MKANCGGGGGGGSVDGGELESLKERKRREVLRYGYLYEYGFLWERMKLIMMIMMVVIMVAYI